MFKVLLPLNVTTPAKKYASIGRCIFCGVYGQLTEEHLLPYGLAGNSLRMPKATCQTCRVETQKFETECLRHMWWPFRQHVGAPSRGKQKPSKFVLRRIKTTTKRPDGEYNFVPAGSEEVEPKDFPFAYVAMTFPEPGILAGRSPTSEVPQTVWIRHEEGLLEKHVPGHGNGVGLAQVNPNAFARLLAKIGHGYARAELGMDFSAALARFIEGKSYPEEGICHWIGGGNEETTPAAPAEQSMHTIRWRIAKRDDKAYVVVDLRLFAFLGSPQYHVVVGEFLGKLGELPYLEQPIYRIEVETPPPAGEPLPTGRRLLSVADQR